MRYVILIFDVQCCIPFWHWIMLCDIPFCNVIRRFNIEHAMRHYILHWICHFDIEHDMQHYIWQWDMSFWYCTCNAYFHFDIQYAIVLVCDMLFWYSTVNAPSMHHSIVTCDMLFWYSMCNAPFYFAIQYVISTLDIAFSMSFWYAIFIATFHCGMWYAILIVHMQWSILFCHSVSWTFYFDIGYAMLHSLLTSNIPIWYSTHKCNTPFWYATCCCALHRSLQSCLQRSLQWEIRLSQTLGIHWVDSAELPLREHLVIQFVKIIIIIQ